MKIHLIVTKGKDVDSDPSVVDAWSENDVEGNPEGFEEAIDEQHEKASEGGYEVDVRVAILKVPDDFFERVFSPIEFKAEIES